MKLKLNDALELLDEYKYPEQKYLESKGDIIVSIIDYITPIMNRVHNLNHTRSFWVRLLRDHVKQKVSRYQVSKYVIQPQRRIPVRKSDQASFYF
jgi:hypothetical protein